MEIIVYLIPFLTAAFLLMRFREETVWWEYVLLIVPSLMLSSIIEFAMKKYNLADTEYLGYYVTRISYYEPWNEYIQRTCTREVPVGEDKDGNVVYRKETYDCSYVEYHPARYTYTLNNGREEYFYNKKEFEIVKERLHVEGLFVDLHRNYHTIDGDKYDYLWNGRDSTLYTMTFKHTYDNYVKKSRSIYRFDDISKKQAKELGLFDYPEISNYEQQGIIGIEADDESNLAVRKLNAMCGHNWQFRLFIVVFQDKGVNYADLQKNYWKGGNKNELIVCIGYDTEEHSVDWCEAFSWSDAPVLDVKSQGYFLGKDSLDFTGYCQFLTPLVEEQWQRKSFSDFSYINIELTLTQVTWLLILTLIYNIGISVYILRNEFRTEFNGQLIIENGELTIPRDI